MRTKKMGKQLVLNKNTVSHLGGNDMSEVVGGTSQVPAPSWDCVTFPGEKTCICEEFNTACSYCDC